MSEELKGTAVVLSGDQPPSIPPPPQPTADVSQFMPQQANPQRVTDKNARVDAVWQQMNKGISTQKLNSIIKKSTTNLKGTSSKPLPKPSPSSWMTVLGLGPKTSYPVQPVPVLKLDDRRESVGEDSLKVAAAALSAVRDAANMAAVLGRGKIEVREMRDFAGESIEVKKLVDAKTIEASEKDKAAGGSGAPSTVDIILEQIKKKPKLSVLDKTKKDWGEFKEENRLDEELETYKKSGNQYLDKVSFLERADYREFERERDARLAVQTKRKSGMSEDD